MKRLTFSLLILLLLASCASQRKITYLQDVQNNYTYSIGEERNAIIRPGDWISILVSSKNMELVQMFNLPIINTSLGGNSSNVVSNTSGYLVDDSGCIDFPQLGIIKAKDFTIVGLSTLIKKKLVSEGYVQDPIVTIQFLNFRVTVIGEVTRPGTFSAPTGRMSILEALSMAGDLTIYGRRENVKVIREENGEKKVVSLDLRNKQLLSSPYYYLQQNDVVYVEPNKAKAGQREINQNRSIGTFASIISVLASLSLLIFK